MIPSMHGTVLSLSQPRLKCLNLNQFIKQSPRSCGDIKNHHHPNNFNFSLNRRRAFHSTKSNLDLHSGSNPSPGQWQRQASTSSSKEKGKEREINSNPSSSSSSSDWDAFSSELLTNSDIDRVESASTPSSSSSFGRKSFNPRVSRQVLFSDLHASNPLAHPDSSSIPTSNPTHPPPYSALSRTVQRSEILRRRRKEKERMGDFDNVTGTRKLGRSDKRSDQFQFRTPLTEPETKNFQKVFDLISDQNTVPSEIQVAEGRRSGARERDGDGVGDRKAFTDEIGNAIELVQDLKSGKGDSKLEKDFRNKSRFNRSEAGGGFQNKSVHQAFEEILKKVSAADKDVAASLSSDDAISSEKNRDERGGNPNFSIGNYQFNPIAQNESLQNFLNRNRLNRFQKQIQRNRSPFPSSLIRDENDPSHGGSEIEGETTRIEREKIEMKLVEIKEEIDSLEEMDQVWDWFQDKVLSLENGNSGAENVTAVSPNSDESKDSISATTSTSDSTASSKPYGIRTPYFSPVLIHLFQTFKTKFNSSESSLTLYEIVKNHSVESLIMSSSIPFFNLVLKTYWIDFRDYQKCLDVLKVAKLVGVLDLEEYGDTFEGDEGRDPRGDQLSDAGRGGAEQGRKFQDESIRETVELIRNEMRRTVLSKMGLNRSNDRIGLAESVSSVPFDFGESPDNHSSMKHSSESGPVPDSESSNHTSTFSIPVGSFDSIQKEFNSTSFESLENLNIVSQMGEIIGKPFRVSSRISRDISRSRSTSSSSSSSSSQTSSTVRPSTPSPSHKPRDRNLDQDVELEKFEAQFKARRRANYMQEIQRRKEEKAAKKEAKRLKRLSLTHTNDQVGRW